ncbi:unnamed protein product, partial [Iphiclides podalirius]
MEENIDKIIEKVAEYEDKVEESSKKTESGKVELKYILRWTSSKSVPFVYMGEGQNGFIERNCQYTNCFVTGDRSYLGDYTKFDVIAFSGPDVVRLNENFLPQKRSPHQKFVFATIESADNYPVCSNKFDGFFNWTWTYRLESEAKWGYIVVRDAKQKIIGPKPVMHWMKLEEMNPVSEDLKAKLKKKSKAAACEDYVTEKLLHGLKHNAVPIVYGGANYTRFMPNGIYLNARDLGAEKLAEKMNELIKDAEQYSQYFRWKDHYSYYRRYWWDPPNRC